jgi:hypothetical protein
LYPAFRKAGMSSYGGKSWRLATFVPMDKTHAKYRAQWIEITLGYW